MEFAERPLARLFVESYGRIFNEKNGRGDKMTALYILLGVGVATFVPLAGPTVLAAVIVMR